MTRSSDESHGASGRYVFVSGVANVTLIALFLLFLFRVVAQFAQIWMEIDFLPPFEAWHSATIPYEFLFTAQIAILLAGLYVLPQIGRSRFRANRRASAGLLIIGLIYFAVMAFRLLVGLSFLVDIAWFRAILPTMFHLVLASESDPISLDTELA